MKFCEKVQEILTHVEKLCPDSLEGAAVLIMAEKILNFGCCGKMAELEKENK